MVPAGLGRTGPQVRDSAALGHVGSLNQSTRGTGVEVGMEGGVGHQKITVGRVKRGWSHCGWSANGEWICSQEGGQSSLRSGLWHCGISSRARGHPRGAAVFICLSGQWLPTVLTVVAFHMEVLVQSNHRHSLLSARLGHDGLCADGVPGSILLVVVGDAVGPVGLVHYEGGALKGAGIDHTGEALRVVGLACGP